MYRRQSSVFLAKRLIDLDMIMSIFPAMASFIMSWKAGRCSVFVPLKPSSEYASYPVLFGGVNLADMHKYMLEVLCNTSDLDGFYLVLISSNSILR